ncbi:hypothetical protein ciss_15330 [Carboxydothermus islandicus]|uniref:Uncharacterized protein n=1 Tax=Carboxydothermus islandicus TaxID=661089 RepID=A0A1L8D345_9THEO|nr:hypothetical protein [Carboxydothermus islandicus]GAV25600.1 hypothetical protein ciss_15330 [Carboxydothermus islandicus]
MKKFNASILIFLLAILVCIVSFTIVRVEALQKEPIFNPIAAYKVVGTSKTDLINYKNQVKVKIDKINETLSPNENVLVTITFIKPLNQKELAELVQNYSLSVLQIKGRVIENKTGLRATISLSPENGNLFNTSDLEQMIKRNDAVFKGFIEIVANVKREKLVSLSEDKLVFLVDPSADKHLISNPKKKFMPGVFWNLEDNGLVAE